jgi:CheY-like chemotaxis protein
VQVAEDVGSAWQLLQSLHFDALLLDAGDGMLDAFQLLDAARASDALSDLPIVISGVWDDPSERDAAFAAGADAYVGNCDRETGRLLIDAVDRLVGRAVPPPR